MLGLMSGTERKNGWQLSEQLGEPTSYRFQQFLYRGSWDVVTYASILENRMGGLVVDETGFLKQGKHSVGVKR